jgi:hypothetical protein
VSVHLIPLDAYHGAMADDGLPHPARTMTVSELSGQLDEVVETLEQGGAILVYTDDLQHRLGVLTRQQPLLDEAALAAEIDAGHLPPIAELIAMDDRGETP